MKPKKRKNQVTKLGANWNNGSQSGAFYWNLNNVSSNRNRNISSQAVNALKAIKPHINHQGMGFYKPY